MIVNTQQNDTLDLVCWRHYKKSISGIIEQVLRLNPHLAEFGAILPYGCQVILPDEIPQTTQDKVMLWD